MKCFFCVLIFQAASLFTVFGQTLCKSDTETNTLSYRVRGGDRVTLSVRYLLYKDDDGDTLPTQDCYIFQLINGRYPRIADCIYGEDLNFRLSNFGETNEQKLLVFYHTGGSQYCLKIYSLDGTDIIPFKTQPIGSNMGYIRFNGKNIIVRNQELNNDNSTTLYTDTYQVIGDECKLVREEKKVLPPATNN